MDEYIVLHGSVIMTAAAIGKREPQPTVEAFDSTAFLRQEERGQPPWSSAASKGLPCVGKMRFAPLFASFAQLSRTARRSAL
jgi:hypothetical protein